MTTNQDKIIHKGRETNFWTRWRNKINNLYDTLLLGLSTLLTIAVFISLANNIPWIDWPLYLDRILFFIILFFLISLIIEFLRGLIFIAIIVGALIFIIYPKPETNNNSSIVNLKTNIEGSNLLESYETRMNNIEEDIIELKSEFETNRKKYQAYYMNKIKKQKNKYERFIQ